MANILSLTRRIKAAQNVSKTTKALQMISASKMKRAQTAVHAARPYVQKLNDISTTLQAGMKENITHPYLYQRNTSGKSLLLVMSPDKGLCGSLITNLIREFLQYKKIEESDISYVVIGKKLEGRIVKVSQEIIASFPFGSTLPEFSMIYPLVKIIDEYYETNKVDSVKILMTEYRGVFNQTPKVQTILPIQLPDNQEDLENTFTTYEPDREKILSSLLKHYLQMSLYLALLESFVSEQAARMMAMQNATNNARDIIDDLQLEYNKTRQAKITNEILDMGSSAIIARSEQ
jgi:F-type H+-transporting ATPase subunit gamma